MRIEGRVEKTIDKKKFLVRLGGEKWVPNIGDIILSSDLRPIAKVVDVIGRVDSPFVLAVLLRENIDIEKLIGKKVSISSSTKTGHARRKG
ncbi:MAG: H/ACA ribonucleoprotein complex subunit GAR1 [Fervidicoccaceae archaeon]